MTKLAAGAALVAIALLAAWVAGCVSTALPPAVELLPATRLALRVGVERDRVRAFSDELLHALRASGQFAEVERLDALETEPDLVDETYGLAFR